MSPLGTFYYFRSTVPPTTSHGWFVDVTSFPPGGLQAFDADPVPDASLIAGLASPPTNRCSRSVLRTRRESARPSTSLS